MKRKWHSEQGQNIISILFDDLPFCWLSNSTYFIFKSWDLLPLEYYSHVRKVVIIYCPICCDLVPSPAAIMVFLDEVKLILRTPLSTPWKTRIIHTENLQHIFFPQIKTILYSSFLDTELFLKYRTWQFIPVVSHVMNGIQNTEYPPKM